MDQKGRITHAQRYLKNCSTDDVIKIYVPLVRMVGAHLFWFHKLWHKISHLSREKFTIPLWWWGSQKKAVQSIPPTFNRVWWWQHFQSSTFKMRIQTWNMRQQHFKGSISNKNFEFSPFVTYKEKILGEN